MASFDGKTLFNKVPIQEFLKYINNHLTTIPFNLLIAASNFIPLVDFCLVNNYFQLKDTFYKQIFGASMGSSLSPVVSCLYMEFFETRLLPNIPIRLPSKWFRYVADCFVFLPAQTNPEETLNALNTISKNIQFTLETETDSRIPFLDVLVLRNTHKLQYSVYRKPTSTNGFTHFFQNHDRTIKKSVASSFFYELFPSVVLSTSRLK